MRKWLSIVAFLVSAICCSPTWPEAAEVARFAGCKTGSVLLQNISSAIEKREGISLRTIPSGNKIGMQRLIDGEVDAAITCRHPQKLAERFAFIAENRDRFSTVAFCHDAVLIVANKNNPVNDITFTSLQRIYQGDINNWQLLGGKDSEIYPFRLDPHLGSGFALLFQERTIGLENEFGPQIRLVRSPRRAGEYVRKYAQAISYYPISEDISDLTILKINGVEASLANIISGLYPFRVTYFITTIGEPEGRIKKLLDYFLSREGQELIGKYCLPLAPQ